MIGSRTTEVSGAQQAALERLYLRKIREVNEKIRRFTATYNDWENADPRLHAVCTREEYGARIEYWYEERHSYVLKLRDVRRGVIHE